MVDIGFLLISKCSPPPPSPPFPLLQVHHPPPFLHHSRERSHRLKPSTAAEESTLEVSLGTKASPSTRAPPRHQSFS